jgi:vancomycin aglycone glucosyltransferase
MAGLAVRLRALGAEVRGCAPPNFGELPARIGVPLVSVGRPLRPSTWSCRTASRYGRTTSSGATADAV